MDVRVTGEATTAHELWLRIRANGGTLAGLQRSGVIAGRMALLAKNRYGGDQQRVLVGAVRV